MCEWSTPPEEQVASMNISDTVLSLTREALADFADPNYRLSIIVRKAIRVAQLRNDSVHLWWLNWEMTSPDDTDARDRYQREARSFDDREDLKALKNELAEGYISSRKRRNLDADYNLVDAPIVDTNSIDTIEAHIIELPEILGNLLPRHQPSLIFGGDVEAKKLRMNVGSNLLASEQKSVLRRIAQRVYEYLSSVEKDILFGAMNADIFEGYRQYIDARLPLISPQAVEQVNSAYRRLSEGDREARSQALTSCRRLLKSIADAVYPARAEPVTGKDGKLHALTDAKYVARLWQFVYERIGGHASGDLLLASVEDIGNRLDRLNEFSSKGVHGDVSEFEVRHCIIQTFLVVGDILHLIEQ
jgi:hypothetical protein